MFLLGLRLCHFYGLAGLILPPGECNHFYFSPETAILVYAEN